MNDCDLQPGPWYVLLTEVVEYHPLPVHNPSGPEIRRKARLTVNNATQEIVNKAWNFAHVLRDD